MDLNTELDSFLEQNPDIEQFDVLIADLNGIIRGKRLPRSAMKKFYSEGILLPQSVFASDIEGDTVDATKLGILTGDVDCRCIPVAGSLKVVPWNDTPAAQVLADMVDDNGQRLPFTPRAVLTKVLDELNTLGLSATVAPELEFFLLDNNGSQSAPKLPVSPITAERERSTQVYGMAELDDYQQFLDQVRHAAKLQGLPTDTAIAEYGPGQFEINLYHSEDPLAACDSAIELKRLVKNVAQKCGFKATFMPKPFIELSGNGFHMHISLYQNGKNALCNGTELGNDTLKHAVAGLQATMAEGMLIAAPGANSYRRFDPECYTPLTTSWGYNNRSVAMRIPVSNENAKRIEVRTAGADANPYLYLASLLGGMCHGITNKLTPSAVTKVNAYQEFTPNLPLSWEAAALSYADAKILPQYLGEHFWSIYGAIKEEERLKFHRQITELEQLWYQRHA